MINVQIRLSMTSKGDGASCVRSYEPSQIEPSTMTSIVLTYAISSQQRDSLLFFLPSSTTVSGYYLICSRLELKLIDTKLWKLSCFKGIIYTQLVLLNLFWLSLKVTNASLVECWLLLEMSEVSHKRLYEVWLENN